MIPGVAPSPSDGPVSHSSAAFLLQLTDVLRHLADPVEIQVQASQLLGEYLDVSRVVYAEITGDEFVIVRDHVRGVASLVGRYALDAFGSRVLHALQNSGTYSVPDVQADPGLESGVAERMRSIQCGAYLGATLAKGSTFNAAFSVHSALPRLWQPAEAAIVADVADRIWAAVERARAEMALREREQQLARVQRIGGVCGFDIDANGERPGRRSPEYVRLHGLAPDVIHETHADWYQRVHPEDRERAEATLLASLAGHGKIYESEYRIVRPVDGRVRWIAARGDIERDPTGRPSRLVGAHIDITHRKAMESDLAESERRLRSLVEGLPQLVWRADSNGAWAWASPQWTAFTGLSLSHSVGRGWLAALPGEDHAAALEGWAEGLEAGRVEFVHRIRPHDGRMRWFQTRAHAVRDETGHVVEWIGSSTDIDHEVQAAEGLEQRVKERTADLEDALQAVRRETDERKRIEVRLLQSERLNAIGQLSGGIAHDFNNLLQILTSGMDMMRLHLQRGQTRELGIDIERSQRAIGRATELTQRLLAFGRRAHLTPTATTFDRLVREVEDVLRRAVGPGVELELQLNGSRWEVECDHGQMENALLNLCLNARDAMPDGGWLTISTTELTLDSAQAEQIADAQAGRYACVSVSDTGTGMTPEVLARAFEPFFTTKPHGQGTGLGLSQIYGFVRQSGGFVQIESQPGKGTSVRLMLPFRSLSDSAVDADEAGQPAVLLVEDQDDVREVTAVTLRTLGCRVLEARDGPSAIRLAKSAPRFDLLVCDFGLPGGLDGQQVIDAIKELRPSVEALLITGYAHGRIRPEITVLRKPFGMQDLARHVERFLPRASL